MIAVNSIHIHVAVLNVRVLRHISTTSFALLLLLLLPLNNANGQVHPEVFLSLRDH
jgi:hypothetical protein